jgi:hypothetical protein
MFRSLTPCRLLLWIVAAECATSSCSPTKSTVATPNKPTIEELAPDPALQAACDELRRLQSLTRTGLTYVQYSDRLLTAKSVADVALEHTSDKAAAEKISQAVLLRGGPGQLDAENRGRNFRN